MRKTTLSLLLAVTVLGFSVPAFADQEIAETAAYGYDSYSCEDLIDFEYDKAESIIYYVRGHYDAKHDIWADYEPSKQKEVFEEDFYVPVEKVYEFCKKNPKSTVVEALTTYND